MERIHNALVDASAFTLEYVILNPGHILIGALLALASGIVCVLVGSSLRNRKRELHKMGKKQRKLHVAQEGADAVCDALEDRYADGRLTRDEVNHLYRRIAHSVGLWDLIPKRLVVYPNQATLKAELLARKAEREAKAKAAPSTPVVNKRIPSIAEQLGIKTA